MTCSAILLVLKSRRAILSGLNVPNSRESVVLSMWSGKARLSSEAFLTQSHSWLSSVLPEFAPLTRRSSNFCEIVVSRQLVEVFSIASNRPDEGLLRFEGVISPCISRFSSKERGDMQCAKAAGSLRPRGHHRGSGVKKVSDVVHMLTGCVSVVSVAPARGVAGSASPQGRGISLHSARPRGVVGLAPAVRGRGRTGRAIGLPVL